MALISRAQREKVRVKVLLMSPSGAGKTYSSLRLAKGMGGKTLLIDSEARRGLYYADEFDYDYVELKEVRKTDEDYEEYKKILPRIDEPFAPENYIALIKYAIDNGYDNLIIDSLTHEWNAKGGILDTLSKMSGNDFAKWKTLTPRHNDFIYHILHSPINVIATVRGKDEYVLESKDGKQVPKKIGLGAVQRDGMEYEYTVTFNIDQESHIATPQKDNTHIFESRFKVLDEEDGIKLVEWANKGIKIERNILNYQNEQTAKPTATTVTNNDELSNVQQEIINVAKEKIAEGMSQEVVYDIIAKYNNGKKNPNSIKDIDTANTVLYEIKNLKENINE